MSEHIRNIQLNPVKSTIMLGIPIIMLYFLSSMYSLIDVYWIDGLGTSAVVCMGYISNLIYVIDNLGDGIGRSTNILISHAFGANEIEKTEKYAEQGLLLILILSFIIPIISIPIIKPICIMANIAEYSDMIFAYIAPCLGFIIIIMIDNFFSAILGSEGDTKRAAIIVVAGNVLNLILDPILIFNLNLGMIGAAIATIIGSLFSVALFYYLYSIKQDTLVKIHLRGFKPDMKIQKEIIVLAVPIIITSIILTIIGIIVTYSLHIYASPVSAFAYIIILNIQSTVFTPIQGLLKGLCIVTGHLAGAKRFGELKKTIKKIISICLAIAIIIALALTIFHNPIISIFSNEYVVLSEVRNILIFVIIYILTFPAIMGCSYVFFGLEKSIYTLMFLIFNLSCIIIFMVIFNHFLGLSSFGIYLSIILSNVIEASLMLLVLKKMLNAKINEYGLENESDTLLIQ
ncbi:MATE family efflux transporter [Methanobrevibacter sp.]|uniref:MATE family efflux transporter n=1 Tax=Methanobrevibacter sp. TaxID=66852 RepID=UPI002E75C2A2|nr:MATE family efflux transporter [Methanobrevibacter sp.]MEE1336156.1 MATE family efflux transporter [Methanobrevibacter sp.]